MEHLLFDGDTTVGSLSVPTAVHSTQDYCALSKMLARTTIRAELLHLHTSWVSRSLASSDKPYCVSFPSRGCCNFA